MEHKGSEDGGTLATAASENDQHHAAIYPLSRHKLQHIGTRAPLLQALPLINQKLNNQVKVHL